MRPTLSAGSHTRPVPYFVYEWNERNYLLKKHFPFLSIHHPVGLGAIRSFSRFLRFRLWIASIWRVRLAGKSESFLFMDSELELGLGLGDESEALELAELQAEVVKRVRKERTKLLWLCFSSFPKISRISHKYKYKIGNTVVKLHMMYDVPFFHFHCIIYMTLELIDNMCLGPWTRRVTCQISAYHI